MSESFRSSIFIGAHLEHRSCAGGSEMRSAAPAIQGGGQADQRAACLYIESILPRRGDFVTRVDCGW